MNALHIATIAVLDMDRRRAVGKAQRKAKAEWRATQPRATASPALVATVETARHQKQQGSPSFKILMVVLVLVFLVGAMCTCVNEHIQSTHKSHTNHTQITRKPYMQHTQAQILTTTF